MERSEKLTAGLDLKKMVGIEIGPLDKPIVRKCDGEVIYVDHTDTASLREKYKNDPYVDSAAIEEVDAIWGAKTLQEAIGSDRKVDYIIASHVIEHVPDLITWLEELRSVLKPTGEVRLAVPDRRFTFDYLRRETTFADILSAYLLRPRMPMPISILDFALNVTRVSNVEAWEGKLDPARLQPQRTVDDALGMARDGLQNGLYHDVHCWVFTPRSFADLFARAGEAGLIRFACSAFYDTERYHIEFFTSLRPCQDRAEVARTWRQVEWTARDSEPAAATPLQFLEKVRSQLNRLEDSVRGQAELIRHLCERNSVKIENLEGKIESVQNFLERRDSEEIETLRRRLESVYDSRSWKFTAPLRAVGGLIRRQRGMTRFRG
ncbi:MAG TPA: methyltransferase domain-containing protein [Acetobacteraceae bacterium]|nr:methyltransferase domain-containing protein [Acetobacteraceae bacterium]